MNAQFCPDVALLGDRSIRQYQTTKLDKLGNIAVAGS
jgi:hypothetical protein